MKISNEAKVGLLALSAILILVLGFNFLKGKSIFTKTPTYYAVFSNIGALEKSNQVRINGLAVGTVYNFVPSNNEVDSIIVEIHLNKDINIPLNSVALIDASLVGASYINIEKSNATSYYKSGDTLSTRLDPDLMTNLKTASQPCKFPRRIVAEIPVKPRIFWPGPGAPRVH